ncbi:hypothetical protein CGRA01v4_11424 [Colletotrichum graminicola]|nr:hypothetical protein CGRA01v4_11424 [Colletotrichum graminicola]
MRKSTLFSVCVRVQPWRQTSNKHPRPLIRGCSPLTYIQSGLRAPQPWLFASRPTSGYCVIAFLHAGFPLHCSSRGQSLMLSGAEAPAPAPSPARASASAGLSASASDFVSAHPRQPEQSVCKVLGSSAQTGFDGRPRVDKTHFFLRSTDSAVKYPFWETAAPFPRVGLRQGTSTLRREGRQRNATQRNAQGKVSIPLMPRIGDTQAEPGLPREP